MTNGITPHSGTQSARIHQGGEEIEFVDLRGLTELPALQEQSATFIDPRHGGVRRLAKKVVWGPKCNHVILDITHLTRCVDCREFICLEHDRCVEQVCDECKRQLCDDCVHEKDGETFCEEHRPLTPGEHFAEFCKVVSDGARFVFRVSTHAATQLVRLARWALSQ